jgi:hypothetical protein
MKTNKIYAVKKQDEWWAVIDCGKVMKGGMTIGIWSSHFKKDGRSYRWYNKLFMPPDDLKEWEEIKILDKPMTVVVREGEHSEFEGWEDEENLGYQTLSNFATLIGKPMTIEEVKKAIENVEE